MAALSFLEINESAPVEWHGERETIHDGVTLKYIRYHSHAIGDFPLWMAAFLAVPEGAGPRPAVLHLHGAAQSARPEVALAWAQRGYVALCPDWSVPANVPNADHATRWPEGIPRTHQTQLEASEATVQHIVKGVRHGISLLGSLADVQSNRIGMVGISWGGLMTWLVNGTDSRLRTAIAVYGSGISSSRPASDSWRAAYQPAAVAATQHAPILHVNGTHDFFGHLDTSESLLRRVGPKARRLYVPNEDHGLNECARTGAVAWLERHLRGDGQIPPEPDLHPGPRKHFFHAPCADRSAVWREVHAHALPETGRWWVTETHLDGLSFSSPVHAGVQGQRPVRADLWNAETDGLNGLYLRWELENLRIHAPATAHLIRTEKGVGVTPSQHRLVFFVRSDTVLPADTRGLQVTVHAPRDTVLAIRLYTKPEIEWTAPAGCCAQDGPQTVSFPFDQFRHTAGSETSLDFRQLHVVRLELTAPHSQKDPPLHCASIQRLDGTVPPCE